MLACWRLVLNGQVYFMITGICHPDGYDILSHLPGRGKSCYFNMDFKNQIVLL